MAEDMDKLAFELRTAIPNKLLNQDGSITDLLGNSVGDTALEYDARVALPNKFLNPDGSYSTLNEIIGSTTSDLFVPTDTLPETGEEGKIYLKPSDKPQENNKFEEYIWKNGEWELIGSMTLDLSSYWTSEQVKQYVDSQVKEVLGGVY